MGMEGRGDEMKRKVDREVEKPKERKPKKGSENINWIGTYLCNRYRASTPKTFLTRKNPHHSSQASVSLNIPLNPFLIPFPHCRPRVAIQPESATARKRVSPLASAAAAAAAQTILAVTTDASGKLDAAEISQAGGDADASAQETIDHGAEVHVAAQAR